MKPRAPLSQKPRWRSGLVLYVAAALALLGLLLLFTSSHQPPTAVQRTEPAPVAVEADDPAESLRNSTDLPTCRNVIERANRWLAGHPDRLPKADIPALIQLRATKEEIAGAVSPTFAPLDAPYLELSLLLADAAQTLAVQDLPPPERARLAFEWVCRQVRLREAAGPPYPPHQVLRRGFGNALERMIVFCALAQQLGLVGCIIDCPLPGRGRLVWLAGAMADGPIYLFEPRLGVPLRTASGDLVTLEQLRQRPDLLEQFDLGKPGYDVKLEQVKGMTAQVGGFLTALTPRMQVLQELLAARRPIQLSLEPRRLLQMQSQAGAEPTLLNLTDILEINYGPELGGRDRLDADKEGPTRQRAFQVSLIDGTALPRALSQLPPTGPLSKRVYHAFERPFLEFYLNPRSARELLVRGRFEEATAQLVELRERSANLRARLANQPDLEPTVEKWLKSARQAEAELTRVKDPAPVAARLDNLWMDSEPVQLLLRVSASQSLAASADYDLALIKHDQAELAQRRSPAEAAPAWRSAADRWRQHCQAYPGTPPEAWLHQARALAMLGQVDAALALLENPPAGLEHWNRQAFLIQAKLLKKAPAGP